MPINSIRGGLLHSVKILSGKGMVIDSNYGIYRRNLSLRLRGKWSIMTTFFLQALIAEEPIFSRLSDVEGEKVVV